MTFQSPSERLASRFKDFVFLGRIDGHQLARRLWLITLIVYGSMIILQAYVLIREVETFPTEVVTFGLFYNSAFTMLSMLIYILLVRLAIEVAYSWISKSHS